MPRKSGDIEADIAEILNDCQKTFGAHRKGLAILKQLYADQSERFLAVRVSLLSISLKWETNAHVYINFLNRILVVWKREPNVERLVQLTVSFAKEHLNFAISLISHLLEHTGAKDRAVRFRTSQLIASIISALPEDAEIEDELWESVSKRMLVRLKDKFPLVRIQAVYALRRLQDPSNADDPVISELLCLLNADTNKDVRRAVLSNIGVFKSTLPSILKRTRDVKEDVRKLAYTIISEKLSVRQLSINQRVSILQDGLDDRDDQVRAACQQLLGTVWYSALGSDPLKVLAALDVEVAENVCEKVVKELLRQRPDLVPKSPLHDSPSKEAAFFYRVACDWYSEQKEVDKLESILPSTAEWCTMVRAYIVNEDQEVDDFIVRQLLNVLPHLDAQEEVGRQTMLAFLRQFLPSPVVSYEVVPVLCKTLARVCGTEDETLQCSVELLADMREPLDDMERGEAREKLEARKQALVAAQERIKVLEATRRQWQRREDKASKLIALNEELEKLKVEVDETQRTMALHEEFSTALRVRCLMMCEHLLSTTTKSVTHGIIAGLRESTVLPGIRHPSPDVRLRAVNGLGLFALLDANAARADGNLLVQIARNDQENVREAALKALMDVTLLFGTKVWITPDSNEERSELGSKVLDSILSALEEDSTAIKTVAAEGVAKLLLADGLKDVEVFARLVALFFSPESADMLLLRQCLSVFFPTYVVNPTHKTTVQQCFLPLVKAVLASSRQSPLRRLPLANVFPFLMSLVPPSENPTEEERAAQGTLAVDLARVVMANPQGGEVKAVLKCLRQVGVQKDDQLTIKKLRCLIDEAERYVKDKLTLRAMNQYAAELKAMDATPDAELDGDDALDLIRKAKQIAVVAAEPVQRGSVSKPAAKRARKQPAKAKEKSKKKEESESEESPSDVESASESEEEEEEVVHRKKDNNNHQTKPRRQIVSSSESEASDDSEEEKEVIRVKKTTARSKAAAQPKRPAAKESEEEPVPKKVASQASDDESTAPPPAPKLFLPKAAAAPKRLSEGEERADLKRAALQPAPRKVIHNETESDVDEEEEKAPKVIHRPSANVAAASTRPVPAPVKLAPPTAAKNERVSPPTQVKTTAPTTTLALKTAARPSIAPIAKPANTKAAPAPHAPSVAQQQQQQQQQRVRPSVKPPVPRFEAKKQTTTAATAPLVPLRLVQRPATQPTTAAAKKTALVKQVQGQIRSMLSSDDEDEEAQRENIIKAKKRAVVQQEINNLLSDSE